MTLRAFQVGLLQQNTIRTQTGRTIRTLTSSPFRSTEQKPTSSPPKPTRSQSSAPNPFALIAIAIAAFGSFAFVVTKRANDPEKNQREQRIPHPDPLKPIRNTTVS